MNTKIKQMLQLAKKRVELSNHFNTIHQSKLLDIIEENKTHELVRLIDRPLMINEQQMILDYLLVYNNIKDALNKKIYDFKTK